MGRGIQSPFPSIWPGGQRAGGPSGPARVGEGPTAAVPRGGGGAALRRQREPAGSNCITLFHRPPLSTLVSPTPKPQSRKQAWLSRSRPHNLGRCRAPRKRGKKQGDLRFQGVALTYWAAILVWGQLQPVGEWSSGLATLKPGRWPHAKGWPPASPPSWTAGFGMVGRVHVPM